MSNTEKYIGYIKPFDEESNMAFRFIEHQSLGDVFFHKSDLLDGFILRQFQVESMAVFSSRASSRITGKFEGYNVELYRPENHSMVLLSQLFANYLSTDNFSKLEKHRVIFESLAESIKIESHLQEIVAKEFIKQAKNIIELDVEYYKSCIKICKYFFPLFQFELEQFLNTKFDDETKLELWLNGYRKKCDIPYISSIISDQNETVISQIFEKCSQKECTVILNSLVASITGMEISNALEKVKWILNYSRYYGNEKDLINLLFTKSTNKLKFLLWFEGIIEIFHFESFMEYAFNIVESRKSIEKATRFLCSDSAEESITQVNIILQELSVFERHELWLKKLNPNCEVDFISDNFFSLDHKDKQQIFIVSDLEETQDILQKLIFDTENISSNLKLNRFVEIIELTKAYHSDYQAYVNRILNHCDDYIKLQLWLKGYHQKLNFEKFKNYVIVLKAEEQKLFIKKVLNYKIENSIELTLDEFCSINVLDYDLIKFAEENYEIEKSTDFSVDILLFILKTLNNSHANLNTRARRNSILEVILGKVKSAEDLKSISGFYNECEGRTFAQEQNRTVDGVPQVSYNLFRNENRKAKNHLYCDGRKALNPCKKSDLEFWWCANQKCYNPCSKTVNSNWENYNLLNFLKAFEIDYDEKEYEIYLNLINKVNRFLPHMKCRDCEEVLYPKGQANFAFYGVNIFLCRNNHCKASNKEIYISHCCNGFCGETIDSRDSVKCRPDGYSENCGWYICKNCYACCNSQQLVRRRSVIENIAHQEYTCHTEGHLDSGKICCFKCGYLMKFDESQIENFNKILNWLESNSNNPFWISGTGVTAIGTRFYMLNQGSLTSEEFLERLEYYKSLGFYIPVININNYVQFISVPLNADGISSSLMICSNDNCDHIINLNSDVEQKNTIKNYHKWLSIERDSDDSSLEVI
jgi:hypothetical protein